MAGNPVTVVGTEKGSCRLGWTSQDHRGGHGSTSEVSRGQSPSVAGKKHPSTELEGELPRGRTELASLAHLGDREAICLGG